MSSETKYPSWVPAELIEEHERNVHGLHVWEIKEPGGSNHESLEKYVAFGRKLLTSEKMRSTWEFLVKTHPSSSILNNAVMFFNEAYSAYYVFNAWKRLTPSERGKKTDEIAKMATELAAMIKNYFDGLDGCIFQYFDESERSALEFAMNGISLSKGEEAIINQYVQERESSGGMRSDSGHHMCYGLSAARTSPPLHELLERFSEKISTDRSHEDCYIGKPNRLGSERLYFIRRLGVYMTKCHGSPRYKLVADTAAVVFDDDSITEFTVREAMKAFMTSAAL